MDASRDEHHRRLERMYRSAPTNEYFRPEIEIGEGTAHVQLVVRPDFFHAASAVHGSVYFKLLGTRDSGLGTSDSRLSLGQFPSFPFVARGVTSLRIRSVFVRWIR